MEERAEEKNKGILSREIMDRISLIAPLSFTAQKLIEITSDDNHGASDILKIVESDSVLTGNILKVVNSAAFGLKAEILSLSRAISYLGDRLIVGIAIGTSAGELYERPLTGYNAESGELWKHSLKTAIASREVAMFSNGLIQPDVAYTCGILHDIGKSIISEFMGGLMPIITESLNQAESKSYLDIEISAIGTTHSEVGNALAQYWKLPPVLQDAIMNHHSPSRAKIENQGLIYIVHLGDLLAQMSGNGTGLDTMQYELDNGYEK
jgi:putative nucleotidyltransferase with HDIG domain